MKRLGHIVAVLAFAVALLVGAAGGAMAHVEAHGAMDHGSHHGDSRHGGSHKAALVVVAPCCPAAEAPADHAVAVPVTVVETSWHARPEDLPDARDITPDTPPPKTAP